MNKPKRSVIEVQGASIAVLYDPGHHFRGVTKLITHGKGGQRAIEDFMLAPAKEETPAPVGRKRQRKDFQGLRTNIRSTGLGLQA